MHAHSKFSQNQINGSALGLDRSVALVQLPFPSQEDPLPVLKDYYDCYAKKYQKLFPQYRLAEGDLWEAPLWVAHLDGAISRDDTKFIDLSRSTFDSDTCISKIQESVDNSHILFFSPLAQNLTLAANVSRSLISKNYKTVVGGNMIELINENDFSLLYSGLADTRIYQKILSALNSRKKLIGQRTILGYHQKSFFYTPKYRLLSGYEKRVPLIRINASHGCLFGCTFCGDAWTKQLHLVEKDLLKQEIDQIQSYFPNTKLIYIGDKTFGQSQQSVENLLQVIDQKFGYQLIVQTHIAVVKRWLLDVMEKLGVEVIEMGFETANSTVLSKLNKIGGSDHYKPILKTLKDRGFKIVLNVLGGLPNETLISQKETLEFLESTRDLVWLYNLYNFVPYPKTPIFSFIRDRIVDWNFGNWREDKPVVFEPFYQNRQQAWDHFLKLVKTVTDIIK